MSEPQYPIRAVARLTGLSIDTLRAWERRYAAVVPERSVRGRQYSQQQIQRLGLLRALVERGHAIGQIASLPETSLNDLLKMEPPRKAKPEAAMQSEEPLIFGVLEALENFQHTRISEELGRLAALLPPRELIYRVALPLMREVGDRWHNGEFGVAQEHLASSALRSLFGALVRLHPVRPGAKKIVMATLEGELHDFGVLAAAMLAVIHGLDPVFLGSSLPASEVVAASKATGAIIVLIGFNYAESSDTSPLLDLASSLPPETSLWVGGPNPWRTGLHSGDAALPATLFSTLEQFEEECQRIGTTV